MSILILPSSVRRHPANIPCLWGRNALPSSEFVALSRHFTIRGAEFAGRGLRSSRRSETSLVYRFSPFSKTLSTSSNTYCATRTTGDNEIISYGLTGVPVRRCNTSIGRSIIALPVTGAGKCRYAGMADVKQTRSKRDTVQSNCFAEGNPSNNSKIFTGLKKKKSFNTVNRALLRISRYWKMT